MLSLKDIMVRFEHFAGGVDLSQEDYSFIRQEIDIDPETILAGGRILIQHFGWLAIQAFDIRYYGSELADPESTEEAKEAFCFGIAEGYETMLGLAAYIENMKAASIDALGLDDDDLMLFMNIMRGKGNPSEFVAEVAGIEPIEEDLDISASDTFFQILADRMASDSGLNNTIELYENLIRSNGTLSSYNPDEEEHHIAGIMHGLASAYGLMKILYGESSGIHKAIYYANDDGELDQ